MVESTPSSCKSAPLDGGCTHDGIIPHDVLDHLIEDLRLHRFLHKVASTLLQRGHNVLLVADGGNHDDASIRMSAHNALRSLDALHLRHGDIHQHHVGADAIVFRDRGAAVSGFTGNLATKRFHHLG